MSRSEHEVWVLDNTVCEGTLERLGDARRLADALGAKVGVLLVGEKGRDRERLFACGADRVLEAVSEAAGEMTRVATAARLLVPLRPRLVMLSGTPDGRAWAARLAVRAGWTLGSPALLAEPARAGRGLIVTVLDASGRFCRKVSVAADETAILTMKPGVAEAVPRAPERKGEIECVEPSAVEETLAIEATLPADPRTVDIRDADRLVAGGRGVDGAEGFAALRRVADRLHAGIAASRVAVDLGWIERERQVGQTGRTVSPELYLACGISGARHHLAGVRDARHIVAINRDPEAPIFRIAHLGLVADLHAVLEAFDKKLSA